MATASSSPAKLRSSELKQGQSRDMGHPGSTSAQGWAMSKADDVVICDQVEVAGDYGMLDPMGHRTPGRMTPGMSPGMTPSRMSPSSASPWPPSLPALPPLQGLRVPATSAHASAGCSHASSNVSSWAMSLCFAHPQCFKARNPHDSPKHDLCLLMLARQS